MVNSIRDKKSSNGFSSDSDFSSDFSSDNRQTLNSSFENPFKFEIDNYENYLNNDDNKKDYEELKAGLEKAGSQIEHEQISPTAAITNRLITEKSKKILYQNTNEPNKTDARIKFINFLKVIAQNDNNNKQDEQGNLLKKTITMKELLGDTGIALFLAAIEEEQRSKSFREALLIKSTKFYDGNKIPKLDIILGGPSASGKTFGGDNLFKLLSEIIPGSPNGEGKGNLVTSADGANDREMSQIRRMLKNVAIAKGYSGISDLHSYSSKLSTKDVISEISQREERLHQNSPETFSKQDFLKKIGISKKGVIQVYGEVVAPPGKTREETKENKAYFQKMVKLQGEERAYTSARKIENKLTPDDLTKIPIDRYTKEQKPYKVESKVYEPENFSWGKSGSTRARKWYQTINKNNIYVKIINDRIAVVKDKSGQWVKADSPESDHLKVTMRELANYNKYAEDAKNNQRDPLSLDIWIDAKVNEKYINRTQPYLQVYHNKKLIYDSVDDAKVNQEALAKFKKKYGVNQQDLRKSLSVDDMQINNEAFPNKNQIDDIKIASTISQESQIHRSDINENTKENISTSTIKNIYSAITNHIESVISQSKEYANMRDEHSQFNNTIKNFTAEINNLIKPLDENNQILKKINDELVNISNLYDEIKNKTAPNNKDRFNISDKIEQKLYNLKGMIENQDQFNLTLSSNSPKIQSSDSKIIENKSDKNESKSSEIEEIQNKEKFLNIVSALTICLNNAENTFTNIAKKSPTFNQVIDVLKKPNSSEDQKIECIKKLIRAAEKRDQARGTFRQLKFSFGESKLISELINTITQTPSNDRAVYQNAISQQVEKLTKHYNPNTDTQNKLASNETPYTENTETTNNSRNSLCK